jgi:hypothetical protein
MQIASEIVRSNKAFIRAIKEDSPDVVEALFRSQIIKTAFRIVALPIPEEIASYITHSFDEEGSVVAALSGR